MTYYKMKRRGKESVFFFQSEDDVYVVVTF